MLKTQETFNLTAENIDKASELFVSVCESIKMDRKETLRQRLAMENALMSWAGKYGDAQEITFISYQKIFTPCVLIKLASRSEYNPFTDQLDDQYSSSILSMLTNTPEYFFSKGINNILFKLKKPAMNPMLKLGLTIAIAFAIAILGKVLLPASTVTVLSDNFVTPLYDAFLNILNCIAGPLVFLSVAWGIYGIGDVATFNKLGKSLMLFFLGASAITAVLSVCLFPVFSLSLSGHAGSTSQLGEIFQMILDFVPSTIIEPFETGNTLQIILLAVVVGITLLYLGKKSHAIAMAIDQLNSVVNFILDIVGQIVPLFIILVIVSILWSDTGAVLATTWKLIIIDIIAQIICCAVFTLLVAGITHVNPLMLAKKNSPAAVIAFSTASSAAAFGSLIDECDNKYGISSSFTSFGVPLAIVTQRHTITISYALSSLFVASSAGLEISLGWLLLAAFVCVMTAVATPPIPGAGAIAYTMLFTQLGLPQEYLGVVIAFDMIVDFVITSAHVYSIPLSITCIANRFGLIDKEIYKSNK